ncbi:MAG: CDP-diacylglycerol--serine O-phosphatidyltransferase [Bacteroidales bacterium]|nr:CDP-diacylglycerol--serine O-phosphatidyltransferase [Bacteroidales bacterium]
MKKHIPNIITLLNLFSGVSGIVSAMNGHWELAFWLMIAGAGFDFFDGMVARLLKVSGPLGAELDSLSDMVTFGVLPSIIMYNMLLNSPTPIVNYEIMDVRVFPLIAFAIAAMSGLRLAKFNIDDRQTTSFIGLPTPANALLIGALSYATYSICNCLEFQQFISNAYFLAALSLVLSYLLVAELPLFALKFKNLSWNDNKLRYIFLGISILLLAIFYKWMYMAILLIIPIYILLSIFNNLSDKKNKH